MRNAIPIGFIALVGILYMVKEKPGQPGVKAGSSTAAKKQSARRAPARRVAIRRAAPARRPKIDRAAMMKKIRAMLAKRRQQQALRKALAAKAAKRPAARRPVAARPLASTPPRTPPRAAPPKMDRAALMKKIRAMLAKRRRQQALLRRPAAPAPRANPADLAVKGSIVELQTSKGNIQLQLFRKKAPITTANFLKYVRSGHYNGTIFHRVIPRFMIQGGGLTPNMTKKPTRAPIKNEADNGLRNDLGTVAMARTGYPHSASAQFFINTKNNTFLNFRSKSGRGWGYCVFAKVIKGMDVVMKISGTPTTTKSGRRNVPATPILIQKAVVVQ